MSKFNDYVFVLLGENFEEVTVATFVTELRKVGLLVKLVGLNSHQMTGAHGLALVPDLTLGRALPLAAHAICVVIPYASPDLRQLKNDPRVCEFLSKARANEAKFVIKQLHKAAIADWDLFPANHVIFYPEGENLIGFVRELSGLLSRRAHGYQN